MNSQGGDILNIWLAYDIKICESFLFMSEGLSKLLFRKGL